MSKKLAQTEGDLERAEERAEMNEMKILELEEELKVGYKVVCKVCNVFMSAIKGCGDQPEVPGGG